MVLTVTVYAIKEFSIMLEKNGTEFVAYDFIQRDKSLGTVNLADYNSSANFIFGTPNKELNLLDNPYFKVTAYKLTNDLKLT